MRSSDTAQIFFEDVRVPQDYIIGEEGMGFTYQMIQFQAERMWGAAACKYTSTPKIIQGSHLQWDLSPILTVWLMDSHFYRKLLIYLHRQGLTLCLLGLTLFSIQ